MGGREQKYVEEAFSSNWLSTVGSHLTEIEAGFGLMTGRFSVALSSGTSALHLALRLAGTGPGDEVVTPTLSFAASANPILYERAVPVFIDSERQTWNIAPALLEDFLQGRARRNRLPKAVIAVHLFGQPAQMERIVEICKCYGVCLIEDAAESLGARYRGHHPGTLGDIGAFSFNGNKMITGTTGGMLVARQEAWADRARKWSQQAKDADPEGINNFVHSELGYNYRMSNVVAGIVRGQLEILTQRVEQRRAVFARYRAGLADIPGIEPQPDAPDSIHSRWLSCFLVDQKVFGMSAAGLIRYLDAANVEARPVWKPLHTQPLYRECEVIGGNVAKDLHRRGICLPSSSSLTESEQAFVIARIREAAGKQTRR
jgi:pyridoxal phosphate-dependent aminotransferase EpsN